MKRKILGVFIALCMVCAFVGCDDPVSEKPSNNTDDPVSENPSENNDAIYKDSAFVGTWVCISEEGDLYEKYTMNYTYILTEDGKGTWTGSVVSGDAVSWDDRNIVWTPLANGEVELYETWMTGSLMDATNIAALSDDGLTLSLGSMKYEKVSDDSSINYKDSGFVGTWSFINTYSYGGSETKWEVKYVLNDDGTGLWTDRLIAGLGDSGDDHEVFWYPLLNGKVKLVEVWKPHTYQMSEIYIGTISDNDAKLSVDYGNPGISEYTKR